MSAQRITQKLRVDIGGCCQHPVYLRWLNKLGAFDQWLFGFNQAADDDVTEGDTFAPYREELSAAGSWQEVLSKRAVPRLTVGASNIPNDKIKGLRGLLHSVKIEMLANPDTWQTDGCKWLTVKVAPGTYKLYETRADRYGLEITLLLPEVQIQTQ